MNLALRVRHKFPDTSIDIAFEVSGPGVTALFGPSGAGKSTTLLAAAGLLRPDLCQIAVGGEILADTERGVWLPPERRHIGLVFQDARLFPHMSVLTNLRFGLRRSPGGRIRLEEVVDLLGIESLLARRPHTLSGGERQRVAIGRALLAQPRLLLMDEPLASLDGPRKAEILPYLARLKTALQLPVLYVTHAMDEVARLADNMVLLEAGRSIAAGPLPEVAVRADLPLALRDDAGAVLSAHIVAHDSERQLSRLEAQGTVLLVPLLNAPVGSWLRLRIPAREVILARQAPQAISVQNILSGEVRALRGDSFRHAVLVEIALSHGALLSRVTPDAVQRLALAPGVSVHALVKSTSIEILE